jgi:hypothetical protein
MLHIESVKIAISTSSGLFGRTITFKKGLNIIRANNTSGKSSLFGAIVYGLGFEELLGSKNEKALQSVFKSVVKEQDKAKNNDRQSTVLQSEIYLQVSNGNRSVTTKRTVIHNSVKPQAVEVFYGNLLTEPDNEYERVAMYLHDKGSATNEEVGFHKFLEDFIGTTLPEIINQEGRRVKLYLPLIAAAHFIEQKSGWSDFYANMPYYGIRDAQSKVFEYILALDVFETAATRQEIQNEIKDVNERWKILTEKITSIVKRGGGEIQGLPPSPEILSKDVQPYIRFYRGDKSYVHSELINFLSEELRNVQEGVNTPINTKVEKIQKTLENLKEQTQNYEILYEGLSSEVSQEKERLRQYSAQLRNVEDDLRKNKDALKVQNLGLQANLKIGTGICPTCNQTINDSLLDSHLHITPMRIDENIAYLNAQEKMIEAFVNNLRKDILDKETKLTAIENAIQANRQRMRALKKDLTSDDRLPSEELIERKVVLTRELNFLFKLREELEDGISLLYLLSSEFERIIARDKAMTKEYHSYSDRDKILFFGNSFKQMLSRFEFSSKPVSNIKISTEKYTPVYEVVHENGIARQIDIRFESSASDFIRAQWAYYTSLMKTSLSKHGNHFLMLLFDEPQQQSASISSFREFLKELESYKEEQVIVLASFQNSEEDYLEATEHLTNFNVIDLAATDELIIQRVQ